MGTCFGVFGVGGGFLMSSYNQSLPKYISWPGYFIGLGALFASLVMFVWPQVLSRLVRPTNRPESTTTSSASIGPNPSPDWLMQLYAGIVLILITIAVADGLVRVMDIVLTFKANTNSEIDNDLVQAKKQSLETQNELLEEEHKRRQEEEKKHSLPAPLNSDDRKLLIEALSNTFREHPYRVKIIAQPDQRCQTLAIQMTEIFKAAHWTIPKDNVPNEFAKIDKGLTVASSYTSPPIEASTTIRAAFNQLGIQYIEQNDPVFRHLDYVILKIGDK
jgi:hypothetical protein